MRELIDEKTVLNIINIFAIVAPILGIVVGTIIGFVKAKILKSLGIGLLIGCAGPLNWVMWRLYNSIVNRYGLDSVKGLWVNLGLFCGLGIVLGALLAFILRMTKTKPKREE